MKYPVAVWHFVRFITSVLPLQKYILMLSIASAAEEVTEYQKRVAEKRAYEEWEKSAWRTLNDYLWLMREWRQYAPASPDEKIDERFVYSLHHLDYAEYLCWEFINYNKAGRLSMKKIVAEIADFQDNLRADFSKL